mmetsp:Transcript_40976/g.95247  ORF Transcript_40976/g.95247 Transcript_40976/m.95247 type:complete len:233 (+) Transcript_40976:385-1083(+)
MIHGSAELALPTSERAPQRIAAVLLFALQCLKRDAQSCMVRATLDSQVPKIPMLDQPHDRRCKARVTCFGPTGRCQPEGQLWRSRIVLRCSQIRLDVRAASRRAAAQTATARAPSLDRQALPRRSWWPRPLTPGAGELIPHELQICLRGLIHEVTQVSADLHLSFATFPANAKVPLRSQLLHGSEGAHVRDILCFHAPLQGDGISQGICINVHVLWHLAELAQRHHQSDRAA